MSPVPQARQQALLSLCQRIGHGFSDLGLLERALTHRSFSADHNERLEFLGDSVLNLAITSLLYARFAQAPEGELSRMRANLVKQDSLHRMALSLQLADHLRLGEGELRSGGLKRPSILADALEAVIGAVYLDAGYPVAEQVVHCLFASIDLAAHHTVSKDPKTALQEWLQARKMPVPHYQLSHVEGAAHEQTFFVDCVVDSLQSSLRGCGGSRRAAEQDAAGKMLAMLAQKSSARSARRPSSRRTLSVSPVAPSSEK